MYHFALHIGDYVTATAHLSMLEDGAYNRLLRRYYQDEKPLPADVAATCRLVAARTKEEREAVEVVLREFFTLEDDGWHNSRADEEIAAYRQRAETARENGRKSGGQRKATEKQSGTPPATQPGTKSVPQTGPSDELTVNRKPVTIGKAPAGPSPDGSEKPLPDAARANEPLEGQHARDDWPEMPLRLRRMPQ